MEIVVINVWYPRQDTILGQKLQKTRSEMTFCKPPDQLAADPRCSSSHYRNARLQMMLANNPNTPRSPSLAL